MCKDGHFAPFFFFKETPMTDLVLFFYVMDRIIQGYKVCLIRKGSDPE